MFSVIISAWMVGWSEATSDNWYFDFTNVFYLLEVAIVCDHKGQSHSYVGILYGMYVFLFILQPKN